MHSLVYVSDVTRELDFRCVHLAKEKDVAKRILFPPPLPCISPTSGNLSQQLPVVKMCVCKEKECARQCGMWIGDGVHFALKILSRNPKEEV